MLKNHPFANLISFFPTETGKVPRTNQIEAFKQIEAAFTSGKKIVIVKAPTGSGKSFIAKTLANATDEVNKSYAEMVDDRRAWLYDADSNYFINSSEILALPRFGASLMTGTKILQDQYENDFRDIVSFKGKSSYRCHVDPLYDCNLAPCTFNANTKKDCQREKICPYYNAQELAAKSKIITLSYSGFFSMPEHISARQLLVFDEASEMEKEIVSAFAVELDTKYLDELGVRFRGIPNEKNLVVWLNDGICAVRDVQSKIKEALRTKKRDKSLIARFNFLDNVLHKLSTIAEDVGKTEFVTSVSEDGRHIKIQPIYVGHIAQRVFAKSEYIVLMSATIIDVETYAKSLGIKEGEYAFVDIPSVFAPEKSPIYFSNALYLTNANLEANLPKILEQVKAIAAEHPNEKGIIHTHNFKITEYLKRHLKGSRFIFRSGDLGNAELIEMHANGPKNSVMVTPSLTHGYNGSGDLVTWQVIVKAPFAPLGDPRIKRLADVPQSRWYTNLMLSTFIQTAGRGTRSESDTCISYVLDGVLRRTIEQNIKYLPSDFVERIHKI